MRNKPREKSRNNCVTFLIAQGNEMALESLHRIYMFTWTNIITNLNTVDNFRVVNANLYTQLLYTNCALL